MSLLWWFFEILEIREFDLHDVDMILDGRSVVELDGDKVFGKLG